MNKGIDNGLLKVMLVDDDLLMLEDMKKLIDWEGIGFYICAVAENGKQALELCKRLDPDLVITDIRMPQMDGLEFIGCLKEERPDIEVLLLTAYSDFDYAKKAISLGVSAYLLKHEINAVSLEKQLINIKNALQRKEDTDNLLRRRCLEAFLCQPDDDSRQRALLGEINSMQAAAWGLFMVGEPQRMGEFASWKDKINKQNYLHLREQLCKKSVLEELHSRFNAKMLAIPCQGTNVIALILFEHTIPGAQAQFELSREVAEFLWNSCEVWDGKPTVLYKAEICSNLSWIYTAFKAVTTSYRNTVFKADRQVTALRDLWQDISADTNIGDLTKLLLPSEISYEDMLLYIEELCNAVKKSGKTENLEALLIYVHKLIEYYQSHDVATEADVKLLKEDICNCCSVKEMHTCIKEFLGKVYNSAEAGCSVRVRKTIQFIHQNYMKDISVSDAAETLGLNPEYLNKLFKKETNEGFSHYLTAYRMKIAKQLLMEGNYRIGEVAEKVGYKSSQYFSVTFRQVMGEPPSAFIKRQ